MEAQEPADPAGHKAETEREVSEQDFLESTDAPSICPACGEPLPDSTNDDPALAECPTCGVEFFPRLTKKTQAPKFVAMPMRMQSAIAISN